MIQNNYNNNYLISIETCLGKEAIKVSDNFNVSTTTKTIQGINFKYCKTVQKGDCYAIAKIKY